jgi:hypothetical protein
MGSSICNALIWEKVMRWKKKFTTACARIVYPENKASVDRQGQNGMEKLKTINSILQSCIFHVIKNFRIDFL